MFHNKALVCRNNVTTIRIERHVSLLQLRRCHEQEEKETNVSLNSIYRVN